MTVVDRRDLSDCDFRFPSAYYGSGRCCPFGERVDSRRMSVKTIYI